MPFVKLDCGILRSTIWFDREAREVFLTALLLAEPKEFPAGAEQLQVDKLEPTGWRAPEGWYGYVPAAGTGIVRLSGVDWSAGEAALRRLGDPEPESRSQDFEGRRMIRIDGGYLILNYVRYRERDTTSAERSKRWRDRKRQTSVTDNVTSRVDSDDTRSATVPSRKKREVEERREKKKDLAPAVPSQHVISREEFVRAWEKRYGERYPFVAKDGVQLAVMLKANPDVAGKWASIVERYLDDAWAGEHLRHGLAHLCANVVKYSGPIVKGARDVSKGWSPPAPASAFTPGTVDMRAIMRKADGK